MTLNARRAGLVLACLLTLLALVAPSAGAASNGRLPGSQLSSIGECSELRNDAAAAYNTLQLYVRKRLPANGCSSAYRVLGRPSDWSSRFGTQYYFRGFWCSLGKCQNAAVPGTSNHGWGLAIDVPAWVRSMIDRFGARFGWCKCWSDAPHESWHLKYAPGKWKQRPNPGTNLRSPILRRGSGGLGQGRFVRYARRWVRRHGQPKTNVRSEWFTRDFAGRVRTFQRRHGLKADGVIGPSTWRKLRNRSEIKRRHR
jgi:hypothetical protein